MHVLESGIPSGNQTSINENILKIFPLGLGGNQGQTSDLSMTRTCRSIGIALKQVIASILQHHRHTPER